jgi:RNase P/RNase MRP subunit POP5
LQNLPPFEPALSAVERVKEKPVLSEAQRSRMDFHQIVRNLLSDCLGSARASRAGFGAPAETNFASRIANQRRAELQLARVAVLVYEN